MKSFDLNAFDVCGADISFAFFGRQGGVSDGVYATLNCDPRQDDTAAHVAENLKRVCHAVGGDENHLALLNQVHGTDCIAVNATDIAGATNGIIADADAMLTRHAGVVLGILTADCAPVLLCGLRRDDGRAVVAAAHAGWRGAYGGVLGATLQQMRQAGVDPDTICAAIGPCIQQRSYEVDATFKKTFMTQTAGNERFFEKTIHTENAFYFDLPAYVEAVLKDAGVRHVYRSGQDTYARADDFFSHRYATHFGNGITGRQLSVIMISTK